VTISTMLKYPLNHTASIWVCSQRVHLTVEAVDDELDVFCGDAFDGFLDNVVTVLVLNAL
jgi:hypothetical protein